MDGAQTKHWIELRHGTQHVPFAEVAHLIALALWPDRAGTDDEERGGSPFYAGARINEDAALLADVEAERLQVLDPLTLRPHTFPSGHALNRALVSVSDLRAYVAPRGIGVRIVPHFITVARPLCVPPELAALPAEAIVTHEHRLGSFVGNGVCSAGDYRASIEEAMARQAEGFFTVDEAAQVLADSRPGFDARGWVERLREAGKAHDDKPPELVIREHGSQLKRPPHETSLQFLDLVKATDVDDWLRKSGAGYGFPKARPLASADDVREPRAPADWIAAAQTSAHAIKQADAARDLYPPQVSIADRVAKDLRERGIFGADGKPLTGATIKRHALKGISSAKGKARSTTPKRGK